MRREKGGYRNFREPGGDRVALHAGGTWAIAHRMTESLMRQ